MYPCPTCLKTYSRASDLTRHRKNCGARSVIKCSFCNSTFTRRDAYIHQKHPTPEQPIVEQVVAPEPDVKATWPDFDDGDEIEAALLKAVEEAEVNSQPTLSR